MSLANVSYICLHEQTHPRTGILSPCLRELSKSQRCYFDTFPNHLYNRYNRQGFAKLPMLTELQERIKEQGAYARLTCPLILQNDTEVFTVLLPALLLGSDFRGFHRVILRYNIELSVKNILRTHALFLPQYLRRTTRGTKQTR